jgi:hypothetical protein
MSKIPEKLTIYAYRDDEFTESSQVGSFEVQVNPESYTRTYKAPELKYEQSTSTGFSYASKVVYPPREKLKLDLIFDGTGVLSAPNAKPYDVPAEIARFKDLALKFQGISHATNFIKIVWGRTGGDMVFQCQLRDFTVKYTLFKPDGTPLRAEVAAVFEEYWDAATRAKRDKKSSPDLSHRILVKQGDTLPMLSYRIYGESRFCFQVAAINRLPNIISIKPGQRLLFPPLKK